MYLAMSMYASDYNGYYPRLSIDQTGGNNSVLRIQFSGQPQGLGHLYGQYLKNGEIYYCPGASEQGSSANYQWFKDEWGDNSEHVYMNYSYACYYISGSTAAWNIDIHYVRQSSIGSGKAILADQVCLLVTNTFTGVFCHGGTYANILRNDGSAAGRP